MGKPIKKTVGVSFTNSDVYGYKNESAVVTFYTDLQKKKTTAKLEDDNLINFIENVASTNIIPVKKLRGFLSSFNLIENKYLQVSTTCSEGDTFTEEEGKKRAMAKVLVRRDICTNAFIDLIKESTTKRFTNVKYRLLAKLDCTSYYGEYYEAYINRRKEKSDATIHYMGERYRVLGLQLKDLNERVDKIFYSSWIRRVIFKLLKTV